MPAVSGQLCAWFLPGFSSIVDADAWDSDPTHPAPAHHSQAHCMGVGLLVAWSLACLSIGGSRLLATTPCQRHRLQYLAVAGTLGTTAARRAPRGIDISTATTEGTATTAWALGLRVLSLPSVSKKVRANFSGYVRGNAALPLFWCLVPAIAGVCSAGKAPAHHRLAAARQSQDGVQVLMTRWPRGIWKPLRESGTRRQRLAHSVPRPFSGGLFQ